MKKVLSLMLAAMMLLSMATAAYADGEEPVTLMLWTYADGELAEEGYRLWIDQVHEAYPYINIDYEVLPYDSGPEKFTVACATPGTTPDLYFDTYSRCAPAIGAGLTLDVTDLREEYADKFLGPQTDGIVDGRYHAIVNNTGAAYCMFMNMTMIKDAGLESMLPEDHLTWSYDEFLALLRALKEAYPDAYPLGLFAGSQSSDMWYYSWLVGNGVELTNEDLTATAFNVGENREKAMQTIELFKTISDEGLCNPGAATTVDTESMDLWRAGKTVIAHGAYSNTSAWQREMDEGTCMEFEYDAYAMPTFEGKEVPMSGSFGSYAFIAFDSHDEAKNDAIRKAIAVYLENPECQTMATNSTGRLSTMTDTVMEYDTEAIAEIMERGTAYSATHTDSSFGVLEDWWTEFRGAFYPNLQDLYAGNIDAGTLLDKWQAAGDEVIANANADK